MNGREKFYQWAVGILIGILVFMGGQRYGETALKKCVYDIGNNDRRLIGIETQLPAINQTLQEIKQGQAEMQKDYKDFINELRKENIKP